MSGYGTDADWHATVKDALAETARERDALREALRREIERRLTEYEGWAGTLDHAVAKELDAALAYGEGET